MGKTFRKDNRYNKFARRDKDAKQKFSKKFQNPNRQDTKPVEQDIPDTRAAEEY